MVAMMDALDLSPVRFRPKTLTDPVRLREDWQRFWQNWNGPTLATHSETLQSASASTTDLPAAVAACEISAPKPQRRQLKFDNGQAMAATPTVMAWTIGQGGESSEDDDELLFGYSPSLQMALDINEKPDPMKIKHERHVFRTKTLLTANSLYRQLSEAESKRVEEYGMMEVLQVRRRRLSDSGIVLSFAKSSSAVGFDSDPPSMLNVSISMDKKRVSFCGESIARTPVLKKNSRIGDYLNVEDRHNNPKPILMKRNKSEPCPLNHMDYPTFKAWRRGRRMSLEAIKAAAFDAAQQRSSDAESSQFSTWKFARWLRLRNVVCCSRIYSANLRPPTNDRVPAVSKILTPISIISNESNGSKAFLD
uniref:Uncharacterized protein n=1 Tax=Plectus sambesii TaxID=2011161 RepID=A0A914VYQ6_9BILA